MSLEWKVAAVVVLIVSVIVLRVVARRRNFDHTRRRYTTRKYRVPLQPDGTPAPLPGTSPDRMAPEEKSEITRD